MRQKRVRVSQRRALATAQNRPTVLLAAKTYGKGVLNPLFSSVFAHVRAENPIFSKTCRRWGKPNTRVTSRKVGHCFGRNLSPLIYRAHGDRSQLRFFCLAIRNQAIFGVAIGQWPTQRWPLDRLSSFLRNLHLPNPSRQPDTLRLVSRVLGLPQVVV